MLKIINLNLFVFGFLHFLNVTLKIEISLSQSLKTVIFNSKNQI